MKIGVWTHKNRYSQGLYGIFTGSKKPTCQVFGRFWNTRENMDVKSSANLQQWHGWNLNLSFLPGVSLILRRGFPTFQQLRFIKYIFFVPSADWKKLGSSLNVNQKWLILVENAVLSSSYKPWYWFWIHTRENSPRFIRFSLQKAFADLVDKS